jgi:guanosine-3',5'-bis(diphosphate) 3'-pyrophosphohydrolase
MARGLISAQPTAPAGPVEMALEFAGSAHAGQVRKQTGRPFIEHPIAVAGLVAERGYDGPVLAAAYLHDVTEKTDVSPEEIGERFGPEVGTLVATLTEDGSQESYRERKRELRAQVLAAGRPATVIYAADRVANLGDWTGLPPEAREACATRLGTTLRERLLLWDEDLEELGALDPELPFLDEIELELGAIHRDVG